MPKAYWIARVDIKEEARYPDYISTAKPAMERFGAKFLARGGNYQSMEGQNRARNVIIEFASMEDAVNCYNSDEYQESIKIRQAISEGEIVIVEGV